MSDDIKNCAKCKATCVQAGHFATRTNCQDYTDGKAPRTRDSSGSTELVGCEATCLYCGSDNLHEIDNSGIRADHYIACFDCWAKGPQGGSAEEAWKKFKQRA